MSRIPYAQLGCYTKVSDTYFRSGQGGELFFSAEDPYYRSLFLCLTGCARHVRRLALPPSFRACQGKVRQPSKELYWGRVVAELVQKMPQLVVSLTPTYREGMCRLTRITHRTCSSSHLSRPVAT